MLPARWVQRLEPEPAGLYEVCWKEELAEGSAELIPTTAAFVDCGTPGDLLAANLLASGGVSVVGDDAVVEGSLEQSVVLPGSWVKAGERIVRGIRLPSGETLLPFETSSLTLA